MPPMASEGMRRPPGTGAVAVTIVRLPPHPPLSLDALSTLPPSGRAWTAGAEGRHSEERAGGGGRRTGA
eukprot:1754540-Rhodomonas_salina.2